MLKDAKGCIEEEDTVQASEKLYKAAEEALKALSEVYAPDLCEEAERRARWTITLLFKAVERIAESLGRGIRHRGDAAWFLHVEVFHEARRDIESVTKRMEDVEEFVNLANRYSRKA